MWKSDWGKRVLCDGWHHPAQVSSLSSISPSAVATQPRHAGLAGPSLVFYHRPMARGLGKNFQLRLQCTSRKTSSLHAAPEQSRCWPAEISWTQLLARLWSWEAHPGNTALVPQCSAVWFWFSLCVGINTAPCQQPLVGAQRKRGSYSNNME